MENTVKAAEISIPRVEKSEDVGVSSNKVLGFLQDVEESDAEVHSFMILRHGKVAAESFRAPFGPDRPHQMYSVSKSVTAAAIGFAIDEGLLSTETRVRDLFPEYTKDIEDENLDMLTVHHLLSMTSGKDVSPMYDKLKSDWIEVFFKAPWYSKPGDFKYINENIYILSVIINKLTGQSLRDYLWPRLFEPLGIDYPFWETDKQGIEAGGWGLYLKTEDLAKFMLCYSNNGKFDGRQTLPKDWVSQAAAVQADNSGGLDPDGRAGYGYCFWHNNGCPNSYRADGMFSQFGIVFKDYDAVFVMTGGIPNEQEMLNLIWRHFPNVFMSESEQAGEAVPNLKEILASSTINVPKPSVHCPMEKLIDGKTIRVRKKIFLNIIGYPVSVLPLAITYMTTGKVGNVDNIVLSFAENECSMSWSEGEEHNEILCGMDGHYRYGIMRLGDIDYTVCCNAEWQNNNELVLHIRPINAIAKRMLQFNFSAGGRITIIPTSTPRVVEIAKVLSAGVADYMGLSEIFSPIVGKLFVRLFPGIVEPTLRGRIARKQPQVVLNRNFSGKIVRQNI